MSNAYEQSGVNLQKGYESVKRIQSHIERTHRDEVLSELGGFGGLFQLDLNDYRQPVLVSGTDGVGTKILLAQQSGKLDTIGIDCVAMCVNDVLAQGAEPLFFLDYLAVGRNNPEDVEAIVKGVAEGCVQSGSALIGGETAEMPDLYSESEFDLAGFSVGIAERDQLITGDNIQDGDVLIGLPSSGIHSNGYSLVRKIFFKDHDWDFDKKLSDGQTLIDHLLTPTKIYVNEVLPQIKAGRVKGIAHITGGGFYENLPRMIGDKYQAIVDVTQWEIPLIFKTMQSLAEIETTEMFNIFNMGIGMVVAIDPSHEEAVLEDIPTAIKIGYVGDKTNEDSVVLQGIDKL